MEKLKLIAEIAVYEKMQIELEKCLNAEKDIDDLAVEIFDKIVILEKRLFDLEMGAVVKKV